MLWKGTKDNEAVLLFPLLVEVFMGEVEFEPSLGMGGSLVQGVKK